MLCVAIGAGACGSWCDGSIDAFGTPVACNFVSLQDLDVCDLGHPDWHKLHERVLARASLANSQLFSGESRRVRRGFTPKQDSAVAFGDSVCYRIRCCFCSRPNPREAGPHVVSDRPVPASRPPSRWPHARWRICRRSPSLLVE